MATSQQPQELFRFVRISVGQSTPSIWQKMDCLRAILKNVGGRWFAEKVLTVQRKVQFVYEGIVPDAGKAYDLFVGHHKNLFVYVHGDDLQVSIIARQYNFDNIVNQFDLLMEPLQIHEIIDDSNPEIIARLQLPKLSRNIAKLIEVKDLYEVEIETYNCDEEHLFNIYTKVEESLEEAVSRVHSAVDELLMLESTA